VAVKLALLEPAATETLEGTVNAELLAETVTVAALATADESVTVQVEVAPDVKALG